MKFDIDHVAPDKTRDVWSRTMTLDQVNRVVERLGTVRDVVGPDVEIAVDAHMHYDVNTSIRLARALAPLNLKWFEDPTPVLNHEAVAAIRAKSEIPICVGEMFTPEEARRFIDAQACDIIHPDVLFAGGLHETRKIAEYAELHQVPVAFHNNSTALGVTASAHVAATVGNCIGIEYHFHDAPWSTRIVERGRPLIEDGYLHLTDRPGLGCELNEDVCRELLADGETLF
jgi:galactonate dehydratase